MTNKLTDNFSYQYWSLQCGYWLFMSLVSLSTLTVWYTDFNWANVAHALLQSVFAIMLSIPLSFIFIKIWQESFKTRLFVIISSVLLASLVWTVARMQTLIMLTPYEIWKDFGGWYFASIFIFLCWAALLHGIKYYQLVEVEHRGMLEAEANTQDELLKRVTAQTDARDAQIKMLRYQLNPHFLCNTLNAINSLIEFDESSKAQKMTVQLSKFLRYSLDHNPDAKIPLANEINALNLYLEIEKTRFGERLQLDFKIDKDAGIANIPSLLLQPVIENSMKHVIAQNENGGTISLKASVVGEQLILEMSDTGSGIKVGRSKIQSTTGRGIGLRNIDERLKVLYQTNYSFELDIMPEGGLKTIIKIPYEPQINASSITSNQNAVS
ncbi:sensor histidine kinase [Colwelliaceae bacterium BS250]